MYYQHLLETIGHTPLIELTSLSPRPGVRLFAKCEGVNPSGSIKDRIARKMIEQAEARHLLTSHSVLVEATSGNTGLALALVASLKGYPFLAVVPEQISQEKRLMLQRYEATVITAPGTMGSNGAVTFAQELIDQNPQYVMLNQYTNEANVLAHDETTAAEILQELPDLTIFVAGLGTGGTLTGCARRLKRHASGIRVVAAEPLQGERIPGLRSLADGFVPPILDQTLLDARVLVSRRDAWVRAVQLRKQEGIFAGPSSGAVLEVALRVAETLKQGKVVLILADGGWKYLSEDL